MSHRPHILSRSSLWLAYLIAGSLGCALYVFVPPLKASGPVINGLGLSGVVAVAGAIRIHRPTFRGAWYCFVAGLALFWLGDIYTYSYPKLFGATVPFPSFGDALYLAVYPVLMTGLLVFVRRRNRDAQGIGLIDALIMTLGLSLVSAALLIAPYIHDHSMGLVPKLVSIGYPTGDILLLAAAIRVSVDAGRRQPAFYLLLLSIGTLLVTDFAYGVMTLDNSYHHQLVLDVGWIFFYLLWGAAALHPSMRELDSPGEGQPRLTRFRLALLAGAALVAPVLELIKVSPMHDGDLIALIGASVLLTLLVLGRMSGLVRQRERSAIRERALRRAASTLVAATSRADIAAAALSALVDLMPPRTEARLCIFGDEIVQVTALEEDGGPAEWTALAPRSLLAAAEPLAAVAISADVRDVLRLPDAVGHALACEVPGGGVNLSGRLVVAGEASPDEDSRIALRTLASQVALALHRAELSEEVHRRESEARFASLVQNATDLITVLDAEMNIVYQSPSVQRVLGFEAEELVGGPFARLLDPNENGRALSQVIASASRSEPQLIECSLRDAQDGLRDFEILCTNMLEQGAVGGIVLNGRDVSERKRFEHQLETHAFRDPVTHLANRALFNERVRHAVARARREQISLAVVFLDLDDFKTVNDSLGHAAGDELLREVAERISATTRAADTAARFGGDEFAVLLEDCELQAAVDTAERIVAALGNPISLDAQDVVVRASLGISIATSGTSTGAEELIRNADAAMYIAKAEGKGGYRIFEPAMHERVLARLELRADLERALERGEFELHYQPVVRLADHVITGVEALLRWHHPTRGLVAPDQFIPFAEETGLIVPIGRWVLREGCMEAQRLRERIQSDPPPGVSINLSVKQLFHPDICEDVEAALAAAGLPASALTLEITETVMMTDTELAVRRLSELHDLGVRLAMDDFGTGYSSLSYLSRFPLDILKMDRSLLAAGGSPITSGLASAVLGLGETFDLEVVAEGIEYLEQSETLGSLGCELGQGFYFARPMPPDELFKYFDVHPGGLPAPGIGGVSGAASPEA